MESGRIKQELRSKMRRVRSQETERTKKSQMIYERLCRMQEFSEAEIVLLYVSCFSEVETVQWIEKLLKEKRTVAVPRVEGSEMEFYQLNGLDELQPGAYGILEPAERCIRVIPEEYERCCIVMPGLAFDRDGHRLGYGGGYYDKYLSKHPVWSKIAVAFECQILKEVPTEAEDIGVDWIATPVSTEQIRHD